MLDYRIAAQITARPGVDVDHVAMREAEIAQVLGVGEDHVAPPVVLY